MEALFIGAKVSTTDAKISTKRYRNILANSGELMESGEKRDIRNLYVMGTDGKLIKISDLNKNPDKQTEDYTVQAQADHGEVIEGMLVPTIEKQFGSCKVWLEDDGLHARMYFAEGDALADHAWAISEHASYSIGMDWFPEGYFGAGYEITEPIGILREISMVLTGNDPRAKTIDSIKAEAEAQGSADAVDGVKDEGKEKSSMVKKLDELTPDERDAMNARIAEVIDEFTTSAPEGETEPTARDESKDDAEAPAEAPAEKTEEVKEEAKDTLKQNILVIKDKKEVKQGVSVKETKDWLYSKEARKAFADCAKKHDSLTSAEFKADWKAEVAKHQSIDGITGLPLPVNTTKIFADTLEQSDGIISTFRWIGGKSLPIEILSEAEEGSARAGGHTEGDAKVLQSLKNVERNVLNKMVYKKLDLTAMQVYENPELIAWRAEELVNAIVVEMERAAISGDGRTAPAQGQPDRRMFANGRGFYSIKADAAQTSATDLGTVLATTLTPATGDNNRDKVIKARHMVKGAGRRILVAKSSFVEAVELAKTDAGYLVQPGASVEAFFGVDRIFTPEWMDNDTDNDAYLYIENQYGLIGQREFDNKPFFDTVYNTDNLLIEAPRGGSLVRPYAAVAIAAAE